MSGKVLFACSKCFSRHPFEELSPGHQLCKDCRGATIIMKCTYCRSEFQPAGKGSSSSICKKCEQLLQQYGKPSACECCNIMAAFGGSKCQRCASSESKYGPPVQCEQCKQRCAFDKHDDNKKIDGKLLCWLCTMSFKRALAKARQVEKDSRLMKKRSHSDKLMKESNSSSTSSSSKKSRPDISKQGTGQDVPEKNQRQGTNNISAGGGSGGLMGVVTAAAVTIDPNSSDHVVAMTNLKEQIASLQKRLNQKDKELLEKDKLITELKGKNFANQNELRNKMRESERLYEMKIELLNKKVTSLLKEVASLKKGVKKNGTTGSVITKETGKDSGGSGTESPITN